MKRKKIFSELEQSLHEALEYRRGHRLDLRVTELPAPAMPLAPRQIREIRRSLHASQQVFARLLNVSANTVESWEQGVRKPRQAALKLLSIARKNPRILLEA